MSELTTEQMREYVETKWETVKRWRVDEGLSIWIGNLIIFSDRVSAAYAFTKQREKEIADVEEEIAWVEGEYDLCEQDDCPKCAPRRRILKRYEGILAELKRGWKGGK